MEKAFNGDPLILEEFKKLIKEFNIKYIIETGTYLGDTTGALASVAQHVHTIELNPEYQRQAKEKLSEVKNIYFYLGSSPQILNQILPGSENNILFFLDAHWYNYCPLIDELKMIAKHKLKPVIAIHDFKVPGKAFGFDSYNGQDYEWSWIKPVIDEIYGEGAYTFWYNSEAQGAQRGIVYIAPGSSDEVLGEKLATNENKSIESNPKPNESGDNKLARKSRKKV